MIRLIVITINKSSHNSKSNIDDKVTDDNSTDHDGNYSISIIEINPIMPLLLENDKVRTNKCFR